MKKTYNVAIVGAGKAGYTGYLDRNIDSHYKALSLQTDMYVDLFDVKKQKGIKTNFETNKNKYDAIIIAVPTEMHLETYQYAVNKNPKLIILEKPAGKSPEEIKTMIRMKFKSTIVNYQRSLTGIGSTIKNLIKTENIITKHAEIIHTGTLENIGCHYIDLMLNVYGPPLHYEKNKNILYLYYPGFECQVKALNNTYYREEVIRIYGKTEKIEVLNGGLNTNFHILMKHPCGYNNLKHYMTYYSTIQDSCKHIPDLIRDYTKDVEKYPSNLQNALQISKIIHA